MDRSGELPSGERFDNIVGRKELLIKRLDLVGQPRAGKLLAFATGRLDNPQGKKIVLGIIELLRNPSLSENGSNTHGIRDLIPSVV